MATTRPADRATGQPAKTYVIIFKWPANHRLEIKGMASHVSRAYLLATHASLQYSQQSQTVLITLPAHAPDPIATVVCLESATRPSATTSALRADDALPPFSWDHVPVYAHVGKTSDDFTPRQLDFLAKHFDFITIEKAQAIQKYGNTEAGFVVAVREIKKRNPKAKVLFYWNASLDTSSRRGGYQAMRTFPADVDHPGSAVGIDVGAHGSHDATVRRGPPECCF